MTFESYRRYFYAAFFFTPSQSKLMNYTITSSLLYLSLIVENFCWEHLRASVWILTWYYMPWSPFEFFIDTPTSRQCETWELHMCIFKQFPERCNYAAILSLLLVLHKLKICLNLNVNFHQINSLICTGTQTNSYRCD